MIDLPSTRLLAIVCALAMSFPTFARAQSGRPLDAPSLPQAVPVPQPSVPSSVAAKASPPKPGSPVVEKLVDDRQPMLDVRRRIHHERVARRRWRHRHEAARLLDRPALAGVELVAPLPPPGEPPHVTVPVPAYPLDSVAAAFTTPPPPIVCHPVRRDPAMPDPRLFKEGAVVCQPDNP